MLQWRCVFETTTRIPVTSLWMALDPDEQLVVHVYGKDSLQFCINYSGKDYIVMRKENAV